MKTILIAEDTESVRKFMQIALKLSDFDVVPVTNGKSALEVLSLTTIDLLITDIRMPEIDGITLIKTIREMPNYKDLPIIVLTGLGKEQVQLAMDIGANSWLPKPFNAKRMQAEINKYLKQPNS